MYPNEYDPIVQIAFDVTQTIVMDYYGVLLTWKIFGLDFGYDIAELVCVSDGDYLDVKQSISLKKALDLFGRVD